MSQHLSTRTLRFEAFSARMQRLHNAARRHGIACEGLVLPAEGMVVGDGDSPGLHYLEWPGPVDSPEVLMLHGGGLHAHSFDLVGNLLRRHARCVAMDLRGHGDSGWASRYGSEAIADDIDAVTAALGLRRVVIVGHSLGGMGAMTWAVRYRDVLAGLVIVDVAPAMEDEGTGSVGAFVSSNPTFASLEDVDSFMSTAFPSGAAAGDGMAANLRWDDDGQLAFKYDTGQFTALDLALGDEQRDVARQICCPTLILRGERSKVIGADAAAELAQLIPGATWKQVSNAGHTIQSSNPGGLAAEVAAFLDTIRT